MLKRDYSARKKISDIPAALKQWDYTKNIIRPSDISAESKTKVWWKCSEGEDHRWLASPNARHLSRSFRQCPYCTNRKPSVTNCLSTKFPEIAKEWHPDNTLKPENVIPNSHQKVLWKCSKGHDWLACVYTRQVAGCPKCAGLTLTDENKLSTKFPDLIKEWHPENTVLPSQVAYGSRKKVWWKCENNHSFKTSINNRTKPQNTGCPYCKIKNRSKIEIYIAFELSNFFQIDFEDHKIEINNKMWDVDIILRKENCIIEYDGNYWHKNKEDEDKEKTKILEANGWKVIRIREHPLKKIDETNIVIKKESIKEIVIKLINILDPNIQYLNYSETKEKADGYIRSKSISTRLSEDCSSTS